MILNERDARHEHILQVARQMMTAARTAPKGKGIDIIEVALITDEDIKLLSDKMIAMVEEHGILFLSFMPLSISSFFYYLCRKVSF